MSLCLIYSVIKKVYKVNPDCDFSHICLSKIKRPVEVKGTVYKTY